MNKVYKGTISSAVSAKPFVNNDGIYVPSRHDFRVHEMLISKELFVEAYNKWIKSGEYARYGADDADCWCE